jgi:hypothetical protein
MRESNTTQRFRRVWAVLAGTQEPAPRDAPSPWWSSVSGETWAENMEENREIVCLVMY